MCRMLEQNSSTGAFLKMQVEKKVLTKVYCGLRLVAHSSSSLPVLHLTTPCYGAPPGGGGRAALVRLQTTRGCLLLQRCWPFM